MRGIGYVLLTAAAFTADQLGKRHSRRFYYDGSARTYGKGKASVTIRNEHNRGMAMNAGENHPSVIRWLNALLIAILIPLFVVLLGRKGHGIVKTGTALLLGGGLSNLWDRFHDGYVTDYMSFGFGPKWFRRLVFNLGDFAIMAGMVMTVVGAAAED